MRRSFFQNNIYTGLFFGMITPFIGFYVVQFIFDILIQNGLMEVATGSSTGRRMRTISLIAICCLLLPFNYFQRIRFMHVVKGILIATFLLAATWIIYFREGIFSF